MNLQKKNNRYKKAIKIRLMTHAAIIVASIIIFLISQLFYNKNEQMLFTYGNNSYFQGLSFIFAGIGLLLLMCELMFINVCRKMDGKKDLLTIIFDSIKLNDDIN